MFFSWDKMKMLITCKCSPVLFLWSLFRFNKLSLVENIFSEFLHLKAQSKHTSKETQHCFVWGSASVTAHRGSFQTPLHFRDPKQCYWESRGICFPTSDWLQPQERDSVVKDMISRGDVLYLWRHVLHMAGWGFFFPALFLNTCPANCIASHLCQ